jgi:4-diphosphocytidyl-2-C-methyl-D-erythritol kinase
VLTLKARAKINLALGVSSPLPPDHAHPGFHEIASWMVALELCDDLHIARAAQGPGQLQISWAADAPRPSPIDWPIESDLVHRAWKILEAACGHALPVNIALVKRVPVGGGLGGGSADAAMALVALTLLFDLPIRHQELRHLSAQLGSDVAFFLDAGAPDACPRPALVTGVGDWVERTAPVQSDVLLIIPPFGCPTRPVYQAFDTLLDGKPHDAGLRRVRALIENDVPIWERELFNDLTPAAAVVAPALEPIRMQVSAALKRPVHVTGSGSCMFALPQAGLDEATRSSWVRIAAQAGGCAIWTRCAIRTA